MDEDRVSEIESLNGEVDAYAQATSRRAETLGAVPRAAAIATSLVTMDRDWTNPPIYGDGANNVLFGGRGTDKIYGNGGDDLLYGGIDDDELRGNEGNDYLLGGMGTDDVYGGPGDDVVQGDATGDKMSDLAGSDVLSFASGGADGFPTVDMSAYPNFPTAGSPERGIYVNLAAGVANNGSIVGGGGGTDSASPNPGEGTVFSDFEHVVGTPFADYIVGDTGANVLEGGGGSDVIKGGGGSAIDVLIGDAGGDNLTASSGSWLAGGSGEDYCGGSTVVGECEAKPSNWVGVRDTTKISVGMTTQTWAGNVKTQIYLAGSSADGSRNGEDDVTVTQVEDGLGAPSYYFSTASSSSKGQFSTLPEDQVPGCSYTATLVICAPTYNAVTMVLAGFGANDEIDISNVFKMTNPIFLGGLGNDTLTGGNYTDDFMHDGSGSGADTLSGKAADDGFMNTDGMDTFWGAEGDDLFVSSGACQGDSLGGGAGTDSSSWAQYQTSSSPGGTYGVFANISTGNVGKNVGAALSCGESPFNSFAGVEDLEGSKHWDVLRGDAGQNQLIGRATGDQLRSFESNDRVLANAGDDDNVDCGAATSDIAIIDYPANGADSDTNCETVGYGNPTFDG
ncbi:MAG: hypothetical protein J0H98_03270 [Solirubrobacterales bacterium]|nr:hypothetical protein [Solirubrobacterales bacterium]